MLGPSWSGLFAVFSILGIVLAVSSHRASGSLFAVSLLSAMVSSLSSFVAFCFFLSVILPFHGMLLSFAGATLFATISQAAVRAYGVSKAKRKVCLSQDQR